MKDPKDGKPKAPPGPPRENHSAPHPLPWHHPPSLQWVQHILVSSQPTLRPLPKGRALSPELRRSPVPTRDIRTLSAPWPPGALQPKDETGPPLLTCHLTTPSLTKAPLGLTCPLT